MKAIIIEDEKLSADHLKNMLHKIDAQIEILAMLDSVKESVAIIPTMAPDLIFLDIHLADGSGFDIFSQIKIETPIIFTTAFSEYAIKAFEVNSVDYLLKPIGQLELKKSIDKFNKYNQFDKDSLLQNITNAYHHLSKQYKSRFMVKIGNSIDSIKVDDILHFITHEGVTFLLLSNGKRYPIDYTLDQLESLVAPQTFFRINRKVILSIQAIQKVNTYLNSRLSITTPFLDGDAARVSRERVNDFKLWLDQ